jgi:hypothetical protein
VDSATAAAWWSVWINLGMAVATVAAALYAWRAYVTQRERDQAEAADRTLQAAQESQELTARLDAVEAERRDREDAARRAQAEQVCVWMGEGTSKGGPGVTVVGTGRYQAALIQNASLLPIHDVDVEFYTDAVTCMEHLDVVGPTRDPEPLAVPGEWRRSMENEARKRIRARMTFRDAAGRLWRRESTGQLTLVDPARRVMIGQAVEHDVALPITPGSR